MRTAIKSNVDLVFDSARGISGKVTIGIKLTQIPENGKLFMLRYYECEYEENGEAKTATLEDKDRYMSEEEINGLAQLIDAKSRINNATFLQDFKNIFAIGLLKQTQMECIKALETEALVNFGSKAENWEIVR